MNFETFIGLEVHVQLKTATKLFCSCAADFGREPNTLTCPVCSGQPGALPVLNGQALALGIRAGLALGCTPATMTRFDRKNYFYPDLPKGYQITQYEHPIAKAGHLFIDLPGGIEKRIRIREAHLEEDAGKTLHPEGSLTSRVDLNRAGIPLLEIVSEPDLRSPREAYLYLVELKQVMRYAQVSDCDMEKGSLRCDANISLRPMGMRSMGKKTEIKNLNSFHHVEKALHYEQKRQEQLLEAGGSLIHETRLWCEDKERTMPMRSKEEAHDYRYFSEPDLPVFTLPADRINEIRATLPELPRARRQRMIRTYHLPEEDLRVLTADPKVADFFELCAKVSQAPIEASNWIRSSVLQAMNERGVHIEQLDLSPDQVAGILVLIQAGRLSHQAAKKVFHVLLKQGGEPETVAQSLGLVQVSDASRLDRWVEEVMERNATMACEYRNGKEKALNALIGQVMKVSKGQANPGIVRALLLKRLHAR
ncbi:MAG: Asp-tRNA(Asn)/Glu-tRNA(Gln) amidotransferase subunit GatB [Planctomycetota bacterium]